MHSKTQAAEGPPLQPNSAPDSTLRPADLSGLDLARPEDAFEALRRIAGDAQPVHGERPPFASPA